ncbi:MAG: TonB-dependent receptor plug domain-containing protein, partial [Bacteroidota bacterium]
MRKLVVYIFLLSHFCISVHAQSSTAIDTLLELPAVELKATTIRQTSVGERQEAWTSTQLQPYSGQHLADLLATETGAFIKSYGNGALATISLRGSGASHTAVLWNGLPIQSPMLGQLDLALLPLGMLDAVSLQLGNNSAGWGSGAIGGVLNLENKWRKKNPWELGVQTLVGSFGQQQIQLQARLNAAKWGMSTRLLQQQADNDFNYIIRADLPMRTQTNAALSQRSLLQEFFYQPTPNQQFGIKLWTSQSAREIPPTTTQNRSEAEQTDNFLRTMLDWKWVQQNAVWRAKMGWFVEQMHYLDPLAGVDSQNDFQVWTSEASITLKWPTLPTSAWKHRIEVGFNHTYFAAEADAYKQVRQQRRTALFVHIRQQWQDWRWQFNIRQELQDGRLVPVVPSLGLERHFTKHAVKLKIGRSYRLPTFNDLYWIPGGNPDLLPEDGWSQELTWERLLADSWQYSTTVYNREITNWIRWALPEDGGFFRPQNIAQVWSRGVEQRLGWRKQWSNWGLAIKGGYDLTYSTNQVAIKNPEIEAGDQLVYVPRHSGFAQV